MKMTLKMQNYLRPFLPTTRSVWVWFEWHVNTFRGENVATIIGVKNAYWAMGESHSPEEF